MAAAASGLSKLTKEPPGLFMRHVSTRLINDGLLKFTPTCCLVVMAKELGQVAAAAAATGSGAVAAADWLPVDLLDGIAREFEIRLSMQLTESKLPWRSWYECQMNMLLAIMSCHFHNIMSCHNKIMSCAEAVIVVVALAANKVLSASCV
jgi:hypothetical protein